MRSFVRPGTAPAPVPITGSLDPLPGSTPPGRRPSPWRSLRHPALRRWTAVNGLSMAGTWMQAVATNLVIWHLTGSAALTGVCVAVQALPGLLLGPLGGALVDRFPLRRTAAAGQVGLALTSLVAAALAATGLLGVPALVALGLVAGTVATVDGPACSLLANTLVPAEDTASAIAVSSVAASAGRLVGTGAAGVAVAAVGVGWAYALNGLTFLVVAVVVPTLRAHPRRRGVTAPPPSPAAPEGAGEDGVAVEGAKASLGPRRARLPRWFTSLALLGAAAGTLTRNYSLALAPLVLGPLHAGPRGYGFVCTGLACCVLF